MEASVAALADGEKTGSASFMGLLMTASNVPLILTVCAVLALLATVLLGFRRACREFLAS